MMLKFVNELLHLLYSGTTFINRLIFETHSLRPPVRLTCDCPLVTPPTKSDNEALSCVSHQPFIFLKDHSLNSLVNRLIVGAFELRITWQCFGLLHPPLLQAFTWKLAKTHQKSKELEKLISDSILGKCFLIKFYPLLI